MMNDRPLSDREMSKLLSDQQSLYRFLTEQMTDVIWTLDLNLKTTYVSPSVEQVYGFSLEERLAQRVEDQVTPESLARITAMFAAEMEREERGEADPDRTVRVEVEYYRKDGSTIWMENIVSGIRDGEGRVIGFHGVSRDISERKRAEEDLCESEERYRLLLQNASDGIFVHEVSPEGPGRFLEVNDQICRMLGYSREEMLGMGIPDIDVPEQQERIPDILRQLFTTGRATFETEHRTKDGRRVPVEVSTSRFFFRGQPTVLSVARDISERRKAERNLQESERKYRLLAENSSDVIWTMDLGGRFTFVSPSVWDLAGFTPEEAMAVPFERYIVREDYEAVMQELLAELACPPGERARSRTLEVRQYGKDGRVIDVEVSTSWLLDEHGEPAGLQGSTRDITARKKAAEALRESETRFRLLVENAPEAIFVQTEGRFVYLNTAAQSLFAAASRDDLMGQPVMERFHPAYRETVAERIRRLNVDRQPVPRIEQIYLRMDGSPVDVEVSAVPVVYRGRNGALVFARDITDRKRADDRLRDSMEQLRKAVGGIIQITVNLVEMRDPYTAGHQRRVSDLARAIAQEVGLPPDEVEAVRMAGSIHDIGKIAVPAEILSKPTRLTDIEYRMIQLHAQAGHDILKEIDFPWDLATLILQHHERMDGSGYPLRRRGDEILMGARVLAVADVVEAISTHRPYRPSLGIDSAVGEITANRGILYDSRVVDACLRLLREKGYALI